MLGSTGAQIVCNLYIECAGCSEEQLSMAVFAPEACYSCGRRGATVPMRSLIQGNLAQIGSYGKESLSDLLSPEKEGKEYRYLLYDRNQVEDEYSFRGEIIEKRPFVGCPRSLSFFLEAFP